MKASVVLSLEVISKSLPLLLNDTTKVLITAKACVLLWDEADVSGSHIQAGILAHVLGLYGYSRRIKIKGRPELQTTLAFRRRVDVLRAFKSVSPKQ